MASNKPIHRNFYDNYESTESQSNHSNSNNNNNNNSSNSNKSANKESLIQYIANNIIGSDEAIDTPFGLRSIVYCDHTASSKPLHFIENYIQSEILPLYANTHTNTTTTGLQTTLLRREARDIIARNCRASRDDVVFFTGNGTTSAIQLFLHCLNIAQRIQLHKETVTVFIGPYEHHSIMLPFRELECNLVYISENLETGGPNLTELEEKLSLAYKTSSLCIGAFSAASNVSGILTDTITVTQILHKHNAIALFDYATAAPYTDIDMNPRNNDLLSKDAIVLSGHKLIGGPASPGILIIKKKWLLNTVPSKPSGGTVFFVSPNSHRYLENFEEREEGGTPAIIGSIRAGLIFQLKENITSTIIEKIESNYLNLLLSAFQSNSNIEIMGNPYSNRVALVSLLIKVQNSNGLYLHSNYVSVLLNDLFGIQSRSGCLCSGPYSQFLLGLNQQLANEFESTLIEKNEILRPGFVRINLHYTLTEEIVNYVIQSILWIAEHGYKLLPNYGFYIDSGEWKHRTRMTKFPNRRWLGTISYKNGEMSYQSMKKHPLHYNYKQYLEEANEILNKALQSYKSDTVDQSNLLTQSARQLRWFLLPSEAMQLIKNNSLPLNSNFHNPIQPATWTRDPSTGKITCHLSPSYTNYSNNTSNTLNANGSNVAVDIKTVNNEPNAILHSDSNTLDSDSMIDDLDNIESKSAPVTISASLQHNSSETKPSIPISTQSRISNSNNNADNYQKTGKETQSTLNKPNSLEDSGIDICKNCFHSHWSSDSDALIAKKTAGTLTKECASCNCTHFTAYIRNSKKEIEKVSRKLQSLIGKAVMEFGMIKEGDRILIGVSGGKDSLTLVHMLKRLQAKAPIKFEIGCVTVDPQTPEYDPSILKIYFKSLGIPYFYESQPVLDTAKSCMTGPKASICSFCARMKRGILYNTLRRENYNVLALGQHADDLAESMFMSIMHNGLLRTMKANYHIASGQIRVIRPLIYVRERFTREYANIADLPVINENCPACFEAPKERARIKSLLAAQEHLHPTLFGNLMRAMKPLIAINHTGNGISMNNTLLNIANDEEDEFDEAMITFKNTKMVCELPQRVNTPNTNNNTATSIDDTKEALSAEGADKSKISNNAQNSNNNGDKKHIGRKRSAGGSKVTERLKKANNNSTNNQNNNNKASDRMEIESKQ